MAEHGKADDEQTTRDEAGVLSSLSPTRPARLSRRAREGAAAGKAEPAPKPSAKGSRGKTTARAKAGAKATAKPASGKRAAAKPARPKAATKPTPVPHQRPRPVRAATPELTARDRDDRKPADHAAQTGVDLAKTVVQAAGEVVQLGATVAGQILRRAVDKLPKP